MNYKAIFKGQLNFGTQRSYDRVVKMYEQRVETYYRARVLFKSDEIFDAPSRTLKLGKRIANNTNKKSITNTLALLNYCSQFAVSGNVGVWTMQEGTLKGQETIEPSSDRSTVLNYQSGKALLNEGKIADAIEAFNNSIEKYSKHSYAYQGLGDAYAALEDYDKAMDAYYNSIEYYNGNLSAHYAMGNILAMKGEYAKAIEHYNAAIKYSIPHEPVFWESRYLKALALIKIDKHEDAIKELGFFTRRNFPVGDPNHVRLRSAYYHLMLSHKTLGNKAEKTKALKAGLKIEAGKDEITDKAFRAASK